MIDRDSDEEVAILPEQRGGELVQACRDNNTASAKNLISIGVPVHMVVDKGWTPLHFASLHGNEELVIALLGVGAAAKYKETKAYGLNIPDNLVTSNTPLMWAAYRGHANICWLLLEAGYDPDEADVNGNTSLHLAASNNHDVVVRMLLRSGASPTLLNRFMHTPLDLATTATCRDHLRRALQAQSNNAWSSNLSVGSPGRFSRVGSGRSLSVNNTGGDNSAARPARDKEAMNQDNILMFKAAQEQLEHALTLEGTPADIGALERCIQQGQELRLQSELLRRAKTTLSRWMATQELLLQVARVEAAEPIVTQRQYCDLVNRLEELSLYARGEGVEGPVQEHVERLIKRSFAEFWLKKALERLDGVDCATNRNIKDMSSLEEKIKKARTAGANADLVSSAEVLLARLQSELTLNNCLKSFPEVRLPIPEPPKDYWQAEDTGQLMETEEWPLPTPEGYKWIHSDAYTRFRKAQGALKYAIEEAERCGANAQLLTDARVRDKASDATLKVLDVKDEEDKALAIAAAEKLAKKLKKGKKGKGKKKA